MKPALYSFRVRDGATRKWRRSKYKMTPEHALIVYGRNNCELIGGSEEAQVFRARTRPYRTSRRR